MRLVYGVIIFLLLQITLFLWKKDRREGRERPVNPPSPEPLEPPEPSEYNAKFTNFPLTAEQLDQTERIVETTLRQYPDFSGGEVYPHLVYKIATERYRNGEISKDEYEALVEQSLKNLPEK